MATKHVLAAMLATERQPASRGGTDGPAPVADVVVTNPTELAIAIQYDAENMAAPVVVA